MSVTRSERRTMSNALAHYDGKYGCLQRRYCPVGFVPCSMPQHQRLRGIADRSLDQKSTVRELRKRYCPVGFVPSSRARRQLTYRFASNLPGQKGAVFNNIYLPIYLQRKRTVCVEEIE